MVEDYIPVASLSLTHVNYNPEDPLSYLCAFLALVPQALIISYVSLCWATREAEIIFMLAGQLSCEVLNFGLKRVIKQERPNQMNGKGYGMPSSHSQFMGYFAIFFTLFLLVRHTPSSSIRSGYISMVERVGLSALACAGALAVALSRIYLNYHTLEQVMAGTAIGVVYGFTWFGIGSFLRKSGWLGWGLGLPPVRYLRIRDLLPHEDLAESGWQRWENMQQESKTRDKKESTRNSAKQRSKTSHIE
ncbi:dolichyldiphosphatase [Nannizzia gypsea CBS 118893]|uniref:Dolichyldiphosphatase n=1 Tax=Arthroderma gypseum (strain ATCC MYA-4604 / CBS 118893) TaxID=535722 RepID=E5QYT1_ARTGP|nr:dolichyldiphosphatase [Nannizzia gypsea CBS 118893]EFQ97269.1 dolichyldiphosphatase [Nannizzia gypsea CBS 118893]